MKTFIVLATLVAASSASFEYDVRLVSDDNTTFPSAYLQPSNLHFKPNMTEVTVSFWTNPKNDNPHYHFTYFIDEFNFIAFRSNSNKAQIALGEEVKDFETADYTPPDRWTNIVLTWTNVDGTARVYVNGVWQASIVAWQVGKVFPSDGTNASLSLGVPYKADDNPAPLPLNTRTSQLNVWSRKLTTSEILEIVSCFEPEPGDIAKWEDSVWNTVYGGSVVETSLNTCVLEVVNIFESIIKILMRIFPTLFNDDFFPEEPESTPEPTPEPSEDNGVLEGVEEEAENVIESLGNLLVGEDEGILDDVGEGLGTVTGGLENLLDDDGFIGGFLSGLGKRNVLQKLRLKRDVLGSLPPLFIKREVLEKIAPRLLKRNIRRGIIPPLV